MKTPSATLALPLTLLLSLPPLLGLSACGGEGEETAATEEPEVEGEGPTAADPEARSAPEPFEGLDGFYSEEQARALLDRSMEVEVRADRSSLSEAEQRAVTKLMAAGEIFHRLYEDSRHPEAPRVRAHLAAYVPGGASAEAERAQLGALRDLYYLFKGPIVVDLENERASMAPVAAYTPARNVYPRGAEAEALSAYAEAHPEAGLLDVRTVVRRRDEASLAADRRRLEAHPALRALHPGLAATLEGPPEEGAFYAVPYALAYAEEMAEASGLLFEAASLVRGGDRDLADYFEQRARDLLSNDYEGGDAAWVSGRFARLNAELGAYETYDDHLLGVKAFFALSILVRSPEASRELEQAVAGLQRYEDALPGGPYGRVRSEIPIGIYDVVADYGQARGANTASILPNEAHITRRYGRTILIRRNLVTNPAILALAQRRFRAVVAEAHADDLGERGNLDRTVWHEVGHYLGPKRTADGRGLGEALGNLQNTFEELKADLVSLWLMPRLEEAGVIDAERRRAAYAAGILRVLLLVRPNPTNAYATMELMQQRFFFERGVLSLDEEGRLHIDYERYPEAVEAMLREVLAIQVGGDRQAAEAYRDRLGVWDEQIQGRLAQALDGVAPRFRLVRYQALSEAAAEAPPGAEEGD